MSKRDWPCMLVKLEDVILSLNTGLNPRMFFKLNTEDATNYYVTIREIRGGKLIFTERTDRINDEALKLCNNRSNLEVGDVLFSGTGTIGETLVVEDEPKNWNTKEGVYTIKPNPSKLNPYYLKYLLTSDTIRAKIMRKVAGGTVKSIPMAELRKIELPLPPLDIQRQIADTLDKGTELIDLRKKQLEKLDELVKARFVEMFGDTILNPFGWKKDSLGAVCDVRDGTHDSPKYYETGYPLVTSKNVTGGKIELTDCSLICEADFNKINERSKVDIGDIIMPMIGTVGKPVIVDIEPNFAIKNVALIKFKANSRVLSIYIRALLQSDYFDDAILSKVRGGTQKFISLGDIRKLKVLVPPIELQSQFASFVEQTDKSKVIIQQSLDTLETLKKSLMQEYFG